MQRTRAVWPAEPKTVAFVDIVRATLAWETSLKCVFGAGAGRRGPHLLNDTGNRGQTGSSAAPWVLGCPAPGQSVEPSVQGLASGGAPL